MLKTIDEIRAQITPNLQKLLNDILLEANDPRPLLFGDEQEFKNGSSRKTVGKKEP